MIFKLTKLASKMARLIFITLTLVTMLVSVCALFPSIDSIINRNPLTRTIKNKGICSQWLYFCISHINRSFVECWTNWFHLMKFHQTQSNKKRNNQIITIMTMLQTMLQTKIWVSKHLSSNHSDIYTTIFIR